MRSKLGLLLCALALSVVLPAGHLSAAGPTPNVAPGPAVKLALDRSSFEAKGAHEAILTVPVFGRYSIAVVSSQGTALQLVDRMAGPGDIDGIPGSRDGRIDAFLERGSYKIKLISDARGSGNAVLAVTPAAELEAAGSQLVENKPVVAELGDHEQRSWWLQVSGRGTYSFEAGGRYLTELRLWRDGAWMVDAAPMISEADPGNGQPLALRQLVAHLEPGLYRLTAYGGAGLPWPNGSAAKPFMLRWGVPALSDAGRTVHKASVLGFDRFLVPNTARLVRLVIDHSEAASVSAQPYNVEGMFDADLATSASIDKTSRDPVAELPLGGTNGDVPWLVTVVRTPGAPYRLEILNSSGGQSTMSGDGDYMIATTLPSNPDDEIDPGFFLVDNNGDSRMIAASAIDLARALPWRRHFNLLEPVQTYLYASKSVDLQIDGSGVDAEFVVSRFLVNPPFGTRVPDAKPSGGVWTLTPGYYVLTASPKANGRGILTMSLHAAGTPLATADSPRLPAALFQPVTMNSLDSYTLFTSLGYDGSFGLRQVGLPAVVEQPLSLELGAGQSASFPIALAEDGELTVSGENGVAQGFAIDGKSVTGTADLRAGQYMLTLAGAATGSRSITVADTPERLLAATPLPVLPDSETLPPVLPQEAPGQPGFMDVAQDQSVTFGVPVDHDALYRFETTGLLETDGAIRTRTNPSLIEAEGNGVGRNFLLQQYLREGDYQLTVHPVGQTAGHLGIAVTETKLLDEGELSPDMPSRITLEPGEAAGYRFHIAAEGNYRIYTLGLGHSFTMRLEDGDGWPLLTPGGTADAQLDLQAGDYRMILLPQTVESRAVTVLHQNTEPVTRQGHGPFEVNFGEDMANRWMEPAAGQPRTPDRWRFRLPAPATVSVSIDSGMRAVILGRGNRRVALTNQPWSGRLPAGEYVVAATSLAPDSRLDYLLHVDVSELVAGQSRSVSVPATLAVSLGADRQYEFSSFGDQDVKASLYDDGGHLVAANDDRDNDWNFLIAGRFPAGRYTLKIDPVGAQSAETEVSLMSPAEIDDAGLGVGATRRITDGQVHVMGLPAVAVGSLMVAGAVASVPVGLALETLESDGNWRTASTATRVDPYLAVPVATAGRRYRLRVWPADHGETPIDVSVVVVAPPATDQGTLASGLDLLPVTVGRRQIGLRRVRIDHAMVLQVVGTEDTLQWSSAADSPVAHDPTGTMVATGDYLWLADDHPHSVAARQVDLSNEPARITLAATGTLTLPLAAPESSGEVALWQVAGQGAQAGIAVGEAGDRDVVMAPGGRSGALEQAEAFQAPGLASPVLRLWQAAAPLDALPVTVRRIGFAAPSRFSAGIGNNDGQIDGGQALRADLPAGWKRLSMNLPAGMVAVLSADGKTRSLIVGDGSLPDVIESDADTLMLLNPASEQASFSVSIAALDHGPELALVPGGMLTHYSATPAILHIPVEDSFEENPPAMPLRAAGAVRDVTAIDAAGMVTSGDGAVAGTGSDALVTVDPGLSVVSVDAVPGAAATGVVPVRAVDAPGSVALAGKQMLLTLAAGDARLVHIETDGPVVLRGQDSGAPMLFATGAELNLFQPKGRSLDLDIEAVGDAMLSGSTRFETVAATPISDGLGPKLRVAPGQSRLFSFALARARSIGVGVRGSVDNASCRLLASDGTVLGSGLVHMHELPPGTYFLAVDVPAGGVAADVQPALVGMTLPDDGPPADVRDEYRALADLPEN